MESDDLVTLLMQAHAVEAIRSYRGNLAFVARVVEGGWIPPEVAPGIQQHLEALRQYLANKGIPEDDSFLLRLGITAPGMQRGIVPPLMVLETNRGGFSARRLSEAEGQVRRMREVLAIGRRFFKSLSPDTQHAISELANLCQATPKLEDAEWLRSFAVLSVHEAELLGEQAVECLSSEESSITNIGTQILQRIACFRLQPLSEAYCLALIELRVFWPATLYRDSGDAVAGHLISLIEKSPDLHSLNHLLLALAWTRSNEARRAFHRWTIQTPGWASKLYAPPEEYLPHAGWSVDGGGQRIDLISTTCFRMTLGEVATPQSTPCRVRDSKLCPSCGGPQGWLFDFSGLGADTFPAEFREAPRKILCCFHCACFGPVFTTYFEDGTSQWESPIEGSKFEFSGTPSECVRQLDDSPFSPFAVAESFALDDASTLGGIPSWLQDAEFPRCIKCNKFMTFLAQHDNGPLHEEGIYYAFFCAPCHVAAVNYQQT